LAFCPAFRVVDLLNQTHTVRSLALCHIVFGAKCLKVCLHRVPPIWTIEFSLVQDEPDLETGIGARDADTLRLAKANCFVKIWVLVAIEDSPDFIVLFIRVNPSALPSRGTRSVHEFH